MKANDLISVLDALSVTFPEKEITSFFACDLLSHMLAFAKPGCGFITVLANENVLAAAKKKGASCVIFADGIVPDKELINKAERERINLFASKMSTFELCGILSNAGTCTEHT